MKLRKRSKRELPRCVIRRILKARSTVALVPFFERHRFGFPMFGNAGGIFSNDWKDLFQGSEKQGGDSICPGAFVRVVAELTIGRATKVAGVLFQL